MLRALFNAVPRALRGWVLPLALLALWVWADQARWSDSPLMVSPGAVWNRAVALVATGELPAALRASLWRDACGLLIGTLAGGVVGAVLGLSRTAEALVAPSFHTLKQISLFAWVPLLSVWFGLGDGAKVAFVALAVFFPVVLNTFEGVRGVPLEFIEVARVLRFTRVQWLRHVVWPSAAPSVFIGLQQALIFGWLATLGAEYLLVSGQGMANLLLDGREHFQMDLVLVGVAVVGAVGFAMNLLASRLERRALAWRRVAAAARQPAGTSLSA